MFQLTRPFIESSDVTYSTMGTSQEASIIIYALGRMNIRDIDVFRNLTNYVLQYHINTASAQTIANILWAHQTVHIEPPRQLLDSWASLKLPGLVIAQNLKDS